MIFDRVESEINQWCRFVFRIRIILECGSYTRILTVSVSHTLPKHFFEPICSQHTVQEVYIDLFSTLDEDLAKILQQECDKHQTGIDIIAVRVTKPTLPPKLAENYLRIEEQKTERRVTEEKMKVTEQESKMELLKATMRAQREAEVARIEGQSYTFRFRFALEIAVLCFVLFGTMITPGSMHLHMHIDRSA